MTGTKAERPELNKMIQNLRTGDIIVIESLSRLGRSTKNLIELMERLNSLGVNVVSLKESIDTTTATGELMFTMILSLTLNPLKIWEFLKRNYGKIE